MNLSAYMVIDGTGEPGRTMNETLPVRRSEQAAQKLSAWLDTLERDWRSELRHGPHKVIEVAITPES